MKKYILLTILLCFILVILGIVIGVSIVKVSKVTVSDNEKTYIISCEKTLLGSE